MLSLKFKSNEHHPLYEKSFRFSNRLQNMITYKTNKMEVSVQWTGICNLQISATYKDLGLKKICDLQRICKFWIFESFRLQMNRSKDIQSDYLVRSTNCGKPICQHICVLNLTKSLYYTLLNLQLRSCMCEPNASMISFLTLLGN